MILSQGDVVNILSQQHTQLRVVNCLPRATRAEGQVPLTSTFLLLTTPLHVPRGPVCQLPALNPRSESVFTGYMGRLMGFPCGSAVKNLPAMQETWVQSLGREDPLEKEMATHSSVLAWWATVHGVARVRDHLATQQQWGDSPASSLETPKKEIKVGRRMMWREFSSPIRTQRMTAGCLPGPKMLAVLGQLSQMQPHQATLVSEVASAYSPSLL